MVNTSMDDRVELLRGSILFAELPEKQIETLAGRLRRRAYRRNEVIFHRGDPSGVIHLIRSGTVKIHLPSEEGDETVLGLQGPGGCFGELAALDGEPRSATVTAVEPVETFVLMREDLLTALRENPDLALALLSALAAHLRRTNEWLEDAYYLDLDQRLARRLYDLAVEQGRETPGGVEVPLPLTQSDLAALVGATRVTINRQLGIYQDARLLRLGRGSFTVTDMEGLRRRAGR
jgi:CRP-like cAMP-binding protein